MAPDAPIGSGTTQTAAIAKVMLAQLATAEYPHLAELIALHVVQPGYVSGDEFNCGLHILLDGLEKATDTKEPSALP